MNNHQDHVLKNANDIAEQGVCCGRRLQAHFFRDAIASTMKFVKGTGTRISQSVRQRNNTGVSATTKRS
jgi:hypothetical protein